VERCQRQRYAHFWGATRMRSRQPSRCSPRERTQSRSSQRTR
jgi:hypothetical protein